MEKPKAPFAGCARIFICPHSTNSDTEPDQAAVPPTPDRRTRRIIQIKVNTMNQYRIPSMREHITTKLRHAAAALTASLLAVTATAAPATQADYDQPTKCDSCAQWNQPTAPFKIHGSTYYVGVRGLSAVLIATPQGLILLDGDLPQSAPLIEANVRALGLRVEDIRYILNSHVHVDHAGGIAALQRHSGAEVVASVEGAAALRAGHVPDDDPQSGYASTHAIPRVAHVKTIRDGEAVSLGGMTVIAHRTPGHTPGGTTWSWRSCEPGKDKGQCYDIVYADSLNAISSPGFRFTGGHGKSNLVPGFRASIAKVAALPCDILITVHPDFSNVLERAEQAANGAGAKAFVDQGACRAYADDALQLLEKRVSEERVGE